MVTTRDIARETHLGRRIAAQVGHETRHFAQRCSAHGCTACSKVDIELLCTHFLAGFTASTLLFSGLLLGHFVNRRRRGHCGSGCFASGDRQFGNRRNGIGRFDNDRYRSHRHLGLILPLMLRLQGPHVLLSGRFMRLLRSHSCFVALHGRGDAFFTIASRFLYRPIGTGRHHFPLFVCHGGHSGNLHRVRFRTTRRLYHRTIVDTALRSAVGHLRRGVFHRR